jgi:hypothetical protein
MILMMLSDTVDIPPPIISHNRLARKFISCVQANELPPGMGLECTRLASEDLCNILRAIVLEETAAAAQEVVTGHSA